jgi:hypothetical protein
MMAGTVAVAPGPTVIVSSLPPLSLGWPAFVVRVCVRVRLPVCVQCLMLRAAQAAGWGLLGLAPAGALWRWDAALGWRELAPTAAASVLLPPPPQTPASLVLVGSDLFYADPGTLS